MEREEGEGGGSGGGQGGGDNRARKMIPSENSNHCHALLPEVHRRANSDLQSEKSQECQQQYRLLRGEFIQ